MDKGVAKIKEFTLFFFGSGEVTRIRCSQQQKWHFKKHEDIVELERGNVMLAISPQDFDNKWEVINE